MKNPVEITNQFFQKNNRQYINKIGWEETDLPRNPPFRFQFSAQRGAMSGRAGQFPLHCICEGGLIPLSSRVFAL